jgi:hypothetical protein
MLDLAVADPTSLREQENMAKNVYVQSVDIEHLEHVFRIGVLAAF